MEAFKEVSFFYAYKHTIIVNYYSLKIKTNYIFEKIQTQCNFSSN